MADRSGGTGLVYNLTGFIPPDARAGHLPGLTSHPRAEVAMLCGRDAARTNAVAIEFGIGAVTLDPAELCASDQVDAVTICTPNDVHGRHVLLARRTASMFSAKNRWLSRSTKQRP